VRLEGRLNRFRRWLHSVAGCQQTRVGIATGLVVVGDLTDAGGTQQRGIAGETPNLAGRLQAIAEPGTVVIAESTRKLLGNLFELEDLGTKDLKGVAGPVHAWAALGTRRSIP
jgi:class 3 adenylate cyclase